MTTSIARRIPISRLVISTMFAQDYECGEGLGFAMRGSRSSKVVSAIDISPTDKEPLHLAEGCGRSYIAIHCSIGSLG